MEQTKKPWDLREAQEIYDGVVGYLASRTEGRAGVDRDEGFNCCYRSPVGPCPVGWLLRDDEFTHSPDDLNCDPYKLFVPGYLPKNDCLVLEPWTPTTQSAIDRLGPHTDLLVELQRVHDDWLCWVDGRLGASGKLALLRLGRDRGLSTDAACEILDVRQGAW